MKGIENCWEFKKCGRQPGGTMADELGVCPVTTASFADGLNRGINGGRICWAIHGQFHKEIGCCINCDFFNLIEEEELKRQIPLIEIKEPSNELRFGLS